MFGFRRRIESFTAICIDYCLFAVCFKDLGKRAEDSLRCKFNDAYISSGFAR